MANARYNARIRVSKERLDQWLLSDAKRFGHHGPHDFVEVARQRHNAAITIEYARDLLARAGY